MTKPILCRIEIKGHLSEAWLEWFGGLEIENQPEGKATLHGLLPDQTALFSVLDRIRDLGLALISLECTEVVDNTKPETPAASKKEAL